MGRLIFIFKGVVKMFHKLQKYELDTILEKHKLWLSDKSLGERADLRDADLRDADLRGTNLYRADLRGADLRGADLCRADLSKSTLCEANLCGTNLYRADLRGTNLYRANLGRANLYKANLRRADFSEADLRGADLSESILCESDLREADLRKADLGMADINFANLCGADLTGAFLGGAYFDEAYVSDAHIDYPIACPEKGSFIGYKQANELIVELLILDTAMRCSATSRKCRCSEAKVISITTLAGDYTDITEVCSNFDNDFIYKVGEIVKVENFDTNRWNECSSGIHFFITRDEAVNY